MSDAPVLSPCLREPMAVISTQHLKHWILEEEHRAETPMAPLTLFWQFIPGPLPNDQATYLLLDRKDDGVTFPHLMFVLQYSSYCYQIALPVAPAHHREVQADVDIRYFPTPWDTLEHTAEHGAIQRAVGALISRGVPRYQPVEELLL